MSLEVLNKLNVSYASSYEMTAKVEEPQKSKKIAENSLQVPK